MKIKALAVGAMLASASFFSLADGHAAKPATMTVDMDCEVLLGQDYSLVPVAIGYIVSANSITEIAQLDPVEVDDIVEACQQAPKSKVSDVVKKEMTN
ncbi:hypothetical protein HGP28_03075 [Vibrio sp. SM6]|uniref:Acid stress chaperone HdeA n=1 Tax=Vibrio agarilyticus TaxID=2726741 RepID=A0A7X8YFG1_9VIBR|nr:HdeA/HdeB family chaperone [Vibrio agarilyticus]NLS11873.1 hypothetical protein [Vibrio agarilyticus]